MRFPHPRRRWRSVLRCPGGPQLGKRRWTFAAAWLDATAWQIKVDRGHGPFPAIQCEIVVMELVT